MKFIKKILSVFLRLFKKKKEKRETIWLKKAITVKELLDDKPAFQQQSVSSKELKVEPKIKEAYKKHKIEKINKQNKLLNNASLENTPKKLPEMKKGDTDIYYEKVTNFILNAKREFTEKEFIERKLEILGFLKTLKK